MQFKNNNIIEKWKKEMSQPDEPSFNSGVKSEDYYDTITPAQILIDKAERVLLGFFFFMLFGLAINNVWMYLIK